MAKDLVFSSRRAFLVGTAAALASGAPAFAKHRASKGTHTIINPLVKQRADAQIFKHTDSTYYMTGSVPEYDRLILRHSKTLAGMGSAPERVLWRRPTEGKLGGYIWAPEMHRVDGRWTMYFAAGDAGQPFHIRTYALQCRGDDPMRDSWALLGQVQTPWDTFTLDSTSFVHRGQRYFCWAQKEPGIDSNSNLYLAPLATATTLARPPVRLSVPTLEWEIQGFKVNEAPALLARNGKLFLTYSASATDARYCLGMLTCNADADIMAAESWSKSPVPVFTTSAVTKVFGPGHNSFTVDDQGRDVLVYHGRDYEKISGDPLFDPNRHTRVQRLYYRADGTPDFGIPVGNGPLPKRFSPAGTTYLMHDGERVSVGSGALPSTQFREVPVGRGSVCLQPIDAPEMVLRHTADGAVSLASNDGSAATLFRRHPGLADRNGVSYEAVARRGAYLLAAAPEVLVRSASHSQERRQATFYAD